MSELFAGVGEIKFTVGEAVSSVMVKISLSFPFGPSSLHSTDQVFEPSERLPDKRVGVLLSVLELLAKEISNFMTKEFSLILVHHHLPI